MYQESLTLQPLNLNTCTGSSNLSSSIINMKTLTKQAYNINVTALRKAKIAHNFGLAECNRVKTML